MLWAKFVIPAAMATVGAGAIVTAVVLPGTAKAGASMVWIDGPAGVAALAPGAIPVTAHATADDTIIGLDLFVDGKLVTNDKTLARNDKLFYGGFTWNADVGTHQLVVRQVGGTGEESDVRTVVIMEGAPAVTGTTSATTTTLGPGETTTTLEPGETTTTTTPEQTTTTLGPDGGTTPTTVPGTTPPVTAPPVTAPPVTQPPAAPVVIDSASLASDYQNRLYLGPCGYNVRVSARIQNADYADAIVQGTDVSVAMTRSGSTWTATLTSGAMFDSSDVGTHQVMVLAGRGDDVADRAAGTVTIIANCPKD